MNTPHESHPVFRNRILAKLPHAEYERLRPSMEAVHMAQGRVLYNVGDPVHHAYFPRGGMISILSTTEDGRMIEVGMIGSEGFAGIPIVLRVSRAPYRVLVQISANAVRIRGEIIRDEFNRGGRLQDLMLRYTHTLLTQVAQSAACNRFHTVEERLCRWLLISRDHMQSDTLHLTQEFLSYMLGVPRTSVTMIAGSLQRSGAIRYQRGKITVLDRRLLKTGSCECYRLVREELVHFLAA